MVIPANDGPAPALAEWTDIGPLSLAAAAESTDIDLLSQRLSGAPAGQRLLLGGSKRS
jgi:hypothetical protein